MYICVCERGYVIIEIDLHPSNPESNSCHKDYIFFFSWFIFLKSKYQRAKTQGRKKMVKKSRNERIIPSSNNIDKFSMNLHVFIALQNM